MSGPETSLKPSLCVGYLAYLVMRKISRRIRVAGKARGQLWLSVVQYLPPALPSLGSSGEYLFVSLSVGSLLFERGRAVLGLLSFGWWWMCSEWVGISRFHGTHINSTLLFHKGITFLFPFSLYPNPHLLLKSLSASSIASYRRVRGITWCCLPTTLSSACPALLCCAAEPCALFQAVLASRFPTLHAHLAPATAQFLPAAFIQPCLQGAEGWAWREDTAICIHTCPSLGNAVSIFSRCSVCISRTPLRAAGHNSAQMLEAGSWLRCSPRTVVLEGDTCDGASTAHLSLQGKSWGLGRMFAFGTALRTLCLQDGDTEVED